MTINTDHLIIQPLAEEHAVFIFELLNTEGWIKYIGNRNIQSTNDAVAYIQKINTDPNIIYWAVSFKDTNTTIGVVTLIKRDYLDSNDIGFAFLPAFSGKGYAYEAVKAVLNHIAIYKAITTIAAITLPGNISSIKLLEKLGLTFSRVIERNNEILHLYNGATK